MQALCAKTHSTQHQFWVFNALLAFLLCWSDTRGHSCPGARAPLMWGARLWEQCKCLHPYNVSHKTKNRHSLGMRRTAQ